MTSHQWAGFLSLVLITAGCDKAEKLVAAFQPALQATGQGVAECKTDVAEWREDVRLHNGQVVQVWRRAKACAGGFPNASRGRDLEFEFRYEPMGVYWRGPANRKPRAFEVFNGVPYLVLYIMDRKSCVNQPPGNYLAQFVKWQSGRWVEVPQADFPKELALLNLHSDYWGHSAKDDAKGVIAVDEKYTGGRKSDTVKDYFERGGRFCAFYQRLF